MYYTEIIYDVLSLQWHEIKVIRLKDIWPTVSMKKHVRMASQCPACGSRGSGSPPYTSSKSPVIFFMHCSRAQDVTNQRLARSWRLEGYLMVKRLVSWLGEASRRNSVHSKKCEHKDRSYAFLFGVFCIILDVRSVIHCLDWDKLTCLEGKRNSEAYNARIHSLGKKSLSTY